MVSRKAFPACFALVVLSAGPGLYAQGLSDSRSVSKTHQARNLGTPSVSLVGQVIMEDGRPLGEIVQIELVCNGRVNQQTMTSPDGTFSFDLGSPRTSDWMDPGIGGSSGGTLESVVKVAPAGAPSNLDEVPSMGRGRADLSGCEVRAALRPGMTSNSIALRTRDVLENPEIGQIVVRRLSGSGATVVSLSILSAPGDARKAFEKANRELAQEKPNLEKASRELEKAVEKHPSFSAAWDLLGRVQMMEAKPDQARQSFLRAVEEEPGFIPPYLALAQVAVQAQHWEEVLVHTGKVLELDASEIRALYWNGLGNYYTGRFDDGEKSLARLYELGHQAQYPFGLLLIGVIHANQGRIPEAASELRSYLELMPPEQVSEAQRDELEAQLSHWEDQGVVALRGTGSPPESP